MPAATAGRVVMTHTEALARLKQCQANQPGAWQIIVSADIITALLKPLPDTHGCGCSDCPDARGSS